ncbi:Signal peptidase I [Methanosarcina siciliae HI350]|uniref:Signal peptidase I n=2 Tax=Methanosarcina siciliae TaxID=38027 RepID=A0A0E3PGC6_9EURY|nr:Signal peptidase I [Methanosarcina siciliae HI350]
MENMKKKETLQVAIIPLIAVILINALIPFFTGSKMPLIVLSGSMTPMMMPGDMIIEESVDPDELQIGDVIVFHPPDSDKTDALVTHRIISLEEGEERTFQTKGDANNAEDDFKVPASNVVGKLIFVIPFAGYLPEISKHKNIFLFTVILPAGLIILDEIRNMLLYSNPVKARKVEKERKKIARRTSYSVKGKRLATFVLISGLIFAGIVVNNLGENGSLVLGKENTIKNPGTLSRVYVITPDDYGKRTDINFWYGVITSSNETQVYETQAIAPEGVITPSTWNQMNETKVIAPENTPATISTVPYILPVFWIISLAEINPYLPAAVEIGFYTFLSTLLLFPLWHRKSVIGKKKKKIKIRRLVAQWKRTLQLV